MSNYEANLKAVQDATGAYFAAVHRLYSELEVGDTTENGCRPLEQVADVAQSAGNYLHKAIHRVERNGDVNFHVRSRCYVIKRKAAQAGKPLLWDEVLDLTASGPWALDGASLKTCKVMRDRRNEHENVPNQAKGHRPGAYVWEVWSYNPMDNTWTLCD